MVVQLAVDGLAVVEIPLEVAEGHPRTAYLLHQHGRGLVQQRCVTPHDKGRRTEDRRQQVRPVRGLVAGIADDLALDYPVPLPVVGELDIPRLGNESVALQSPFNGGLRSAVRIAPDAHCG